ncbi:MAG TPA: Ig-like domain-containing protein [Candidatus Saccharimonadales bacterium]|nr:Ig-like domain-containing protein [Candidatus Saccharimonadales bacterium]
MTKKNLFIAITSTGLLFFIFLGILLLAGSKRSQDVSLPSFTTPTPIDEPGGYIKTPLKLLETSPVNGSVGVEINQPIIFTFNQSVATESVSFAILPEIGYTISSRLYSLIITPTTPYDANIIYTYSLFTQDGQSLTTGTFSAGLSPNPVKPLTGRYPNLDTVSEADQRQQFPDLFLASYVPFSTSSFSVADSFSASPSGHYEFTVTQITKTAKEDFLLWIKQLGLTQTQIDRLQIYYQ